MTFRTLSLTLCCMAGVFSVAPLVCAQETLTFSEPETAGISGLRPLWDVPVPLDAEGAASVVDKGNFGKAPSANWLPQAKARQNGDGPLRPGALAFDAVHRSLLVRFPGAAEAIAARLRKGDSISKVELALPFKNYELWPEGHQDPAGMSFLGTQWANWKPRWHAVAYGLRRPWKQDATAGPTFNSYINGAGYWAKFGAQDEEKDRFPQRFGPGEVSSFTPDGKMDVTAFLRDEAFGKTVAERLRRLEYCGFLVRKWEVYDASLWQGGYEWQTATGARGVLVGTPKLEVTFSGQGRPQSINAADLKVDMTTLSANLKKNKTGGSPTAVLPSAEELKKLSAKLTLSRPTWMPDWQWKRVQELAALGGGQPFPETPEAYNKWIDDQMGVAPRAWRGFDAAERVDDYFKYLEATPAPVQEHWKLYWSAWLMPERPYPTFEFKGKNYNFAQGYIGGKEAQAYQKETNDWRGNFSVYRTYCYAMGTMNFNNWCAIGTLGGGRIVGSPLLINDGRNGVENFSFRLWSWFDGSTQESIDHYYFAESLTAQKVIQNIAPGPFEKMMGQSILAKSVEELSSSWHPGLRRFVSSSGRTGIAYALGIQEGLSHVIHTLSPSGALTDLNAPALLVSAPNVEKMPVLGSNLKPGRVAEQSVDTPWAPDWVANMVENKPIPYEATNSYKQWGRFSGTPLWKRSYLGENYGLATVDVASNEAIPFMAQWRRDAQTVASMTGLGTLVARGGTNRTELLDSIYHGTKQRNPNGIVGMQGYLNTAFQHKNKAIVLSSPTEQLAGDQGGRTVGEVTSLQTTLGLMNFEATPSYELYVEGQRVTQFPFKAKFGQRITIKDGVSYLGILPLPATNLGRQTEVELVDDGQMTDMQGGGKMREALRINLYNYQSETPLDKSKADWKKISGAYNGFIVEVGDAKDSGTFAEFQRKFGQTKLEITPGEKDVVSFKYTSGPDVLEASFNPHYNGGGNTREVFPVRTVNGAWPYNAPGMERDTTLTQQGSTGKLEKNGAVVQSEPGRMAYLQTEPKSGTYSGFNAFPDPAFWSLAVPGNVQVKADGRLGMARVTIRPKENKLWVDYALRDEQKKRPDMASALFLTGLTAAPQVWLNEKLVQTTPVTVAGQAGYALPLRDGPVFETAAFANRMQKSQSAATKLQSGDLVPANQLVQDWRVLGPFAVDAELKTLDTPRGPEKDAVAGKLDWAATYPLGDGKTASWKALRTPEQPKTGPGSVDLLRQFQPNTSVIAYAATKIISDAPRTVNLLMGSDDTLAVWLNGKQIWNNKAMRGVNLDQDSVQVPLLAGENQVLLKIGQGTGGWGYAFRVGDEFGVPVPGVSFSAG